MKKIALGLMTACLALSLSVTAYAHCGACGEKNNHAKPAKMKAKKACKEKCADAKDAKACMTKCKDKAKKKAKGKK